MKPIEVARILRHFLFDVKHWCFLVAAFAASCSAQASCSFNYAPNTMQELNITVPVTLTVPRDTANNAVLYTSKTIPPPDRVIVKCSGDPYGVVNSLGSQPESGVRIYPIGTTGLSFRWVYTFGSSTYFVAPLSGPLTLSSEISFSTTRHAFQLVKTGPIADNATIPAGAVGTWNFGTLIALKMNLSNAIKIVPQTCQVLTPNVVVPMTPVAGLPLKTFTGMGSTSDPVAFSIDVNCSGVQAAVYMTLTDQQTPENTSTTLPLSIASTATGIGIQVLQGAAPVKFGPASADADNPGQFLAFKSASTNVGVTRIPLTARYVQTSAALIPGSANGLATFTMSYQ